MGRGFPGAVCDLCIKESSESQKCPKILSGEFKVSELYQRPERVHENFIQFLKKDQLPSLQSSSTLSSSGLSSEELWDLFESQLISRHLDLRARELKSQGKCFYTIGSAGHEGNAALGKVFRSTDMAFLHYRSGAFFIQRSKQLPESTPIYDMMLSFVASSEDPIAGGRHKVFGSYDLNVPPQTSTIASHLPKAIGAALSISRARDLNIESRMPKDSLIYCSFGDASANHSSAAGAINSASWIAYQNIPMPLVFVCEDNGIGISVPTPNDWIAANYSAKPGIMYFSCDGLNLCDVYQKTQKAVNYARNRRKPVFLHVKTVRLMGHAGSDVESAYRPLRSIESTEKNDPLLHTARILQEQAGAHKNEIHDLYIAIGERVLKVADEACGRPKLETPAQVKTSVLGCHYKKKAPDNLTQESFTQFLGRESSKLSAPLHMAKLISLGLHECLKRYSNAMVFGEDVAQKGGVYHVTEGLYKKFGVRRVFNSLLDETTILGTAIGLAHNGFLPIPEIQFLAYVHNAEDQIRGEAATLPFFSNGQFTNPMVIRVAGLAYQKGFGGHFHNDNSLAIFRDLPGVVVACPSNGADAVKMLRRCVRLAYEEGRVVIFVEPIALYMTRDLYSEGDKLWSFQFPELGSEINVGDFSSYGEGNDLTIISYGNGYYYSRQAHKILEEKHGHSVRVIDLRWISDIQYKKLIEEIGTSSKILIVDECRKSGSPSEGIVAGLLENWPNDQHPPIQVLAAEDCFIPLGVAAAAGLPKCHEIVIRALDFISGGHNG